MASIEEMVKRYKGECTALIERCLQAEADRDLNDRIYNYEREAHYKAEARIKELEEQLKDCESRNTQLLARLDLMKEALEEHGIAFEDKCELKAVITTKPYDPNEEEADG